MIDSMDISSLRENYTRDTIDESSIIKNPILQFEKWMKEAIASDCIEPNAMALATVNQNNEANARIVLLKGFSDDGFIFYTNYESEKAINMKHNPNVSVVFNWLELQRQVRINGRVEKVSKEISEKYFHSRPRGSQIGAHVSPQSKVIPDRNHIEDRLSFLNTKFEDIELIPLPINWGGYSILPTNIEFWQGRPNRLHDRLRFSRSKNEWRLERLAP